MRTHTHTNMLILTGAGSGVRPNPRSKSRTGGDTQTTQGHVHYTHGYKHTRIHSQVLAVESGQTLEAKAGLEETHREMDRLRRDLADQMHGMKVCAYVLVCVPCILAAITAVCLPDQRVNCDNSSQHHHAFIAQRELDRRDEKIRKLELQLRGAYRCDESKFLCTADLHVSGIRRRAC